MKHVEQAVILAGGLGTRLRPLTNTVPKPMIRIHGKPFLWYLIQLLKKNHITRIVILVGYKHHVIERYFGDGKKFGVAITYSYSPVEADTGTRIQNTRTHLDSIFLLMYGDNYWPLNLRVLEEHFVRAKKKAIMTIYKNIDHATRDNVVVKQGMVVRYDRSRATPGLQGVDIGFFLLRKSIFRTVPKTNFSFEDVVVPRLVKEKHLAAYVSDHKYYSLSTPDRIPMIETYLRPRSIVFLDRDGVINQKAPKATYITKWSEFKFLPNALAALALLAKKRYEIYLVTNQAGIARGMMTVSDLTRLHARMKKELVRHGIHLSDIYVCPHGWDEGCECRKPKPGLFFQAASDHHINLRESYCIGDDERDIQAGELAGCTSFLVGTNECKDLLTAARRL